MFGLRKFNTPFARPMMPFFVGAVSVIFLIGKAQTAMIESKYFFTAAF
jgi:F-type H+-transporting ATPase subunit j